MLLAVTLVFGAIVFIRPASLVRDLTWGEYFIPFAGDGRWLTPIGVVPIVALVLFLVRCVTAKRPLVDLRGWGRSARDADLIGALFLAVALGGVILAFATADPSVQVFSDQGLWYLLGSAVATVAFVLHLRRAEAPLVPRGALRRTPAWGAVVVSFFVGAALIAALIDIPIFARTTVYRTSQLMAALVLVRFLVALPVGRDRRRLPDPHPQRRAGHRGRHGDVGGRLRADVAVGRRDPARPVLQRRAGGLRLRLRARAGAGQRRDPGQHRPGRARRLDRDGRGGPDGRDAGRHLGADHDRAAPLLRRAGHPQDA